MKLVSLLIFALGQAAVESPTIGVMLDASGALRPVYGVAGNFTLGPPVEASIEPNRASPTLAIAQATIYSEDGELVLRWDDASQVRFALRGVIAIRAMSKDWVQVATESGNFALRVERGREALFTLPVPARAEVRRR